MHPRTELVTFQGVEANTLDPHSIGLSRLFSYGLLHSRTTWDYVASW